MPWPQWPRRQLSRMRIQSFLLLMRRQSHGIRIALPCKGYLALVVRLVRLQVETLLSSFCIYSICIAHMHIIAANVPRLHHAVCSPSLAVTADAYIAIASESILYIPMCVATGLSVGGL